ncbi:MAG: thiamine S protein [Methanomicrobium sp.]|nr:thiamine S protein [Methanomicrobium sp.]
MKCRMYFKRENEAYEFAFEKGALLCDILLLNNVIPDTVIIFKDDVPVPEDCEAEETEYLIFTTSSRG